MSLPFVFLFTNEVYKCKIYHQRHLPLKPCEKAFFFSVHWPAEMCTILYQEPVPTCCIVFIQYLNYVSTGTSTILQIRKLFARIRIRSISYP